ncbi:DNA adenine methylase [Staphylococcus agnetis]|uniref:type II restriction endonuclease n=1 Tax=Staphylococcus agnetis TaxID=985762 RepID=UPI000E04E26A|nr:type II restriction endonuclease [Staphylococcus agnetis]SUK02089.1 DNA adenine methylase [Staphylococcus agnetis]
MNYSEYVNLNSNERLEVFLNSLSSTNKTPSYFVNWEKVENGVRKFELELNTMNYLLGKHNIEEEAEKLFRSQPNLLKTIPILIATRDKKLDILMLEDDGMDFYSLDFMNINTNNMEAYLEFIKNSGLLSFLQNSAQKNLVDFVYGVEVGLDSNARKNRSGTTMEGILEKNVAQICEELNFEFKTQATSVWMKQNWDVDVPTDKSARRFDVAILNPINKSVHVIETNFYNGGGSKLKSVSGEFKSLNQFINQSENKVTFAWVTDGQGWHTATKPLSEAFAEINNIFNLEMLRKGYIYKMLTT